MTSPDAAPTATVESSDPSHLIVERAPARVATLLEIGALFAGRYRIEGQLGKGGFGIVYRVLDEGPLQRRVALKILQQDRSLDPARAALMCQQFIQEARLAASLSHPNIVTVFEVGTHEGQLYFTQELIAGRDLHAHQKDVGHFTVEQALSLISSIGAALSHAHGKGVLHQDIKPSNILRGYNGHIKLTDFGLARAMGVRGALPGTGGTPGYMSPEQIRGDTALIRSIDARSDQFALGCVAYELLCGRRPFEADTLSELFRKTFYEAPVPLSTLRGDVPGGVISAIDRALQKDPAARFDTVQDFVSGLVRPAMHSSQSEPNSRAASPHKSMSFEQHLAQYLTAMLSQHAQIPLIGVNPELKLTLGIDDVYVPLRADIRRGIYHDDKWQAKHPGHLAREDREPTDIDLAQAFKCADGKRGVVILGNPGSGKTTLLKLLLVRCIRNGGESLGLPPDVVPVMLPLRDLKGDKNLDDFFQRSLSENPHLTLPLEFARALREARPLLYLLDGLDEVPDENERASVSKWILAALQTRTNAWFAVTSRYAGYQGDARLDDHFVELNVRGLREAEARALVQNFYRIVETSQNADAAVAQVNATEKAAHLWELLASDQHRTRRMRELQDNPLLLTILCLVHQRYNDLPDRRWRLYEQCVDTLVWHWRKAVRIALPFNLEDSRKLLLPLAHWLHQEKERRHATADEVVMALAEPLSQLSVTPDGMRNFLRDVRDRSGLLVGWGKDSYGFIHLAFQERATC